MALPTGKKLFPPKFPELPANVDASQRDFYRIMYRWWQDVADQVNKLAEGRIDGHYNSDSATPASTVIQYNLGDKVWNNSPSVTGSSSAQYVVTGWECVSAGSPGDWVEMRSLTGT